MRNKCKDHDLPHQSTSDTTYSSQLVYVPVRDNKRRQTGCNQQVGTHLVDKGGGARNELDVVAIEDELILDLLGPQDGHALKHVHLPDLIPGSSGKPTSQTQVRTHHNPPRSDLLRFTRETKMGTFFSPRKFLISMAVLLLVMEALMGKWA